MNDTQIDLEYWILKDRIKELIRQADISEDETYVLLKDIAYELGLFNIKQADME